ncbi:acyl-CoA desaturase [Oceaniserpentilla sp. 4NH20-0058]|uniref:acyl-CoA desaturase n=1 Tax=Oceaniserpentilla sp. 4NH20-0058 TaxID=3127660 RepID=UPI00333FF04A
MNHMSTSIVQVLWQNVIRWVDSEAQTGDEIDPNSRNINWIRCLPFFAVHVVCLCVIWVGVSYIAIMVCLLLFWLRMFAITGFYHRYFSHKSFKMNRFWQFIFAFIANSSAQRGPLWWASHHRKHHKHSDQNTDLHSPVKSGFWWSHIGWFICESAFKTDYSVIRDWERFPELKFLNRFDIIAPTLLAVLTYLFGEFLASYYPHFETNGWQMLIWGFFVSTVILFHATFTINSLGHIYGNRRFDTKDNSRNNPWLAFITLGEGWHNNHHRFAVSTRQGFYWWELDITYYILVVLNFIGIVKDLNPVPARILEQGLKINNRNFKS